jgi:hypothetical protein
VGRIAKIKRELIMEANKKLLGEQEANPLSDEIHDKILKVGYLSQRFQKVEDFLNELITTIEEDLSSIEDRLPDEVDAEAEPTPRAMKELAFNICNIVEEGGKELKEDIDKDLSKIKNVLDIIIELNSPPSLSEGEDSNLPAVIPPSTGEDEDDIEDIEYEDVTDEEENGESSGVDLLDGTGTLALATLELAPAMFTGVAQGIGNIVKITQSIGNSMINIGVAVKVIRKMVKCMRRSIHYPTQKLKQAKNVYNYLRFYYTEVNEKIELINKYKNLPNKNKELDNIIIILTTKINKGLISLLEKLMDPNSIDPPESEISILKQTIQYIFNPASMEELKELLNSTEKVKDEEF